MKKSFLFVVLLMTFLVVGCNGERVSNPYVIKNKPELAKTADYKIPEEEIEESIRKITEHDTDEDIFDEENITGLEEKLELGNGFRLTGHFELNAFGEGESCQGMIYRKEYKESFFYLFVDCNNNKTKQIVRK